MNQAVAPSSGFPGNIPMNLGRVDNSGIELRAVLQALDKENLRWEVSGSMATNNDVIKDLGGLPSTITAAGTTNRLGYPIQGFWSTQDLLRRSRSDHTCHHATCCAPIRRACGVPCASGASSTSSAASCPAARVPLPRPMTLLKRLRLFAMFDFQRGNVVFNGNEAVRCTRSDGARRSVRCELLSRRATRRSTWPRQPQWPTRSTTSTEYVQDASYVKLREMSAVLSAAAALAARCE